MDDLTLEEKAAYVARIDEKARQEGISNKHAARKLGLHEWKYYQYKNDIKRNKAVTVAEKTDEGPVKITIMLTRQAYSYVLSEANDFALSPEVVAQMILHNAIMKAQREVNNK